MAAERNRGLSSPNGVMAAIDEEGAKQLVIADLSRDGAWIAVDLDHAARPRP